MSHVRERERPPSVRALDDGGRRLIRPERDQLDERTLRLHEGSTEPGRSFEGSAQILELRSRGPERVWLAREVVDDVLRDMPDATRAPAPVQMRGADPPTMPDRTDRPSSDVFQSIPTRGLVVDPDGERPTPLERPMRFDERPTELDAARREAPTATYHAARDIPVRNEPRSEEARERGAQATAHERALIESMYDSQRKFIIIQDDDPRRAEHIESVKDALMTSNLFKDRERVLAIHARQRLALEDAPAERHKEHEDQVLAIALAARELDDRYRETMRELKDQLVKEVDALPTDKREAVYADFDSFMEKGGGNDSHHCRRELDQALNKEIVLHRAYVYALALDKQRARPAHDPATSLADDERKKPNE